MFFSGVAAAQSSEAFIQQVGLANEATVVQMASAAFVLQDGEANRATIEQVGEGGHLVRLEQYGGSTADVLQIGAGNGLFGLGGPETAALQHDASHLVLVQEGTGNAVLLEQAAGGFARITQNGMNNTATVIQN